MPLGFSFDTVENFDDHILKSIPGYGDLFDTVVSMSKYFIRPRTNVYDIGCSTGKLLEKLGKQYPQARMIGIDRSKNLLKESKGIGMELHQADLNEPFVFVNSSLIVSMFTLQFLEKRVRGDVIRRAWEGLNKGGALIIAEKIYSCSPMIQDISTFMYYDFKKASFTSDEIMDKERDLRCLLMPLTESENIDMINDAGFTHCDVFWRRFNFEALLCIK